VLGGSGEAQLSLVMIERVLTPARNERRELDRLMALLRRFEMEAALEQGARCGALADGARARAREPMRR